FHRVMKIITQLIDVAKLESNDDIIQAVQAKLAQMNKRDGLDTPSEAPARPQPEEAETKAQPTPEEQSVRISNRASRVRAAVDSAGAKKAPTET
ncbi:MAG: hypothetical protein O7G87_18675, partial [bacterium]|nr:hypothetical protein [bacterium]